MPTTNYMNPTSAAPDIGWTPNAAEGGLQWALRNADYRTNMDLSQAMSQIGLQTQQQDLAKTIATQPGAIGAMNAKNQADIQYAVPQAQANLASTQQKTRETTLINDFNSDTFKSRVTETLASNAEKAGERGMKELQRGVEFASQVKAYKEALGGTPMNPAVIQAMAKTAQINPNEEFVRTMIDDPNTVQHWSDTFQKADAKLQAKLRETREKGNLDYERETAVARIKAEMQSQISGNKPPKADEVLIANLAAGMKERNDALPDNHKDKLTDTQIIVEATKQVLSGKYGAAGGKMESPSDAGQRTAEQNVGKLKVLNALQARNYAKSTAGRMFLMKSREAGLGKGQSDEDLILDAYNQGYLSQKQLSELN